MFIFCRFLLLLLLYLRSLHSARLMGAEKLSLFDAIFNTQAHTRAQRVIYIKETVVGCWWAPSSFAGPSPHSTEEKNNKCEPITQPHMHGEEESAWCIPSNALITGETNKRRRRRAPSNWNESLKGFNVRASRCVWAKRYLYMYTRRKGSPAVIIVAIIESEKSIESDGI